MLSCDSQTIALIHAPWMPCVIHSRRLAEAHPPKKARDEPEYQPNIIDIAGSPNRPDTSCAAESVGNDALSNGEPTLDRKGAANSSRDGAQE
jgi:hypothetical protein